MRALLVIDANSEEIVYSKRFPTVEARLKAFHQQDPNKSPLGLFDYVPLPDNGIFKLAFSRQVIQKVKLENEKKRLPFFQDYKIDAEEWDRPMLEAIQKQFEDDTKCQAEPSKLPHLYRNGRILSLKVNLSRTQTGELWPILYLKAKDLYYIVAAVSMIEEDFQLGQEPQTAEETKEQIKLTMEEKSQTIIVALEYLQKIQELLELNDRSFKDSHALWEWLSMIVDMSAPFGSITSSDLSSTFQIIKASAGSNMLLTNDQDDCSNPKASQLRPIPPTSFTKQNEWEQSFKFQLAHKETVNQSQTMMQSFRNLDLLSTEKLSISPQTYHQDEKLFLNCSEEIFFVQKPEIMTKDKAPLGMVVGQIRCLSQFQSPCEISLHLTSKRELHNPQTTAKCKIEEVEPQKQQIKSAKLVLKAVPNEWLKIMTYEIPIRIKDGILPVTGKYQFKQISQNETKIWIKLNLHSQLESKSLRILIPIFNMTSVGSVAIKCSTGTISKIQHQDRFCCLLWTLVENSGKDYTQLTDMQQLQGSIFSGEESQVILEDHYDPQYEDILLRSNEQLLQQNYQELTVESSENYNLINKESLNFRQAYSELKGRMARFTEEDFWKQKLKFTDLDSSIIWNSGMAEGHKEEGCDDILNGISNRPYLLDKQTYIKVEFVGRIGAQLLAQLDFSKVMFYPHRDGIEVRTKEEIRTHKYIIWNSLAEEQNEQPIPI